jgi:hypothetical protein
MQTKFQELIQTSRFNEASSLLQQELLSGQLIDPRSDPYWSNYAEQIANLLREERGENAVTEFWEGFVSFLRNDIESKWGHVHKGHLYFRLGRSVVLSDIQKGKSYLEAAFEEDKIFEQLIGQPEANSQSAYIILAILEQIEDSEFSNAEEKRTFITRFFKAFDTAITGRTVKGELIESALASIVPAEGLSVCRSICKEVQVANNSRMPFTLVSITGTFLESLILAHLYYRKEIKELKEGKSILKEELGPLLAAASGDLPSLPKLAFKLVHLFRNRLHPGNEIRQIYKLVPGVSMAIKAFCDFAILDWSQSFHSQ